MNDFSHIPRIFPVQQEKFPKTFFWDGEELDSVKRHLRPNDVALKKLIWEADGALSLGPFSVTHKKVFRCNRHDFYSLSPYFWPNKFLPSGKPYYFRDGFVNPEAEGENDDRMRYLTLLRTLQKLSLAYYYTGKEIYAERVFELMRVWFLNEETRMNPNFNHAQVIPGMTGGSSLGVIRGTELVQMLDCLALCDFLPSWTQEDREGLQNWFKRYFVWVRKSALGRKEYKMKNNHGTWYDAHVSAVALFIGDEQTAKKILFRSAHKRIEKEIAPDGSQPHEISRSRSWYYAIYNLRGLFEIAHQAEKVGLDLWHFEGKKKQGLRMALDVLIPYAVGQKEWDYEQILPEDGWMTDFIPLLVIAAKKYHDPSYLEVIAQLPPLPDHERVRVLYLW